MSGNPRPAIAVPPGRILCRELEARGWTQRDLAVIMGRPVTAINEIIKGAKQITPQTAIELAQTFGTSPEFWTNLESNYRLCLAQNESDEKEIVRKSRLYGLVPLRDLLKRAWVKFSESIEELENEVLRFLEISSLDETPKLAVRFRMTQERGPETNAQIAWIKRVEHLARAQEVAEFSRARLSKAILDILAYSAHAEDAANVPSMLMDLGVHFVIVPHLPKTFIDGAMFYLETHPVIALTLRYDRIDAFWFTLMHELGHVIAGHRGAYLDNFDVVSKDQAELEANQLARNWLVDQQTLARFVRETRPYFSRRAIELFAQDQSRNPGIILGLLQHDKVVGYSHLRATLVKLSPCLKHWIDAAILQPVHTG